jgi:3',5'-cyclic AMP phosphodiesterase CpdA
MWLDLLVREKKLKKFLFLITLGTYEPSAYSMRIENPIKLRVAILSDPHFFTDAKADHDPSWLGLQNANFTKSDNPWNSLEKLLEQHNLKAELLISPGDITTRADADALKVAWNRLISLGGQLKAHTVVAATGNHDVSSRAKDPLKHGSSINSLEEASDLFENLKQLDPCYPVHELLPSTPEISHSRRVHYFGADFVIVDEHPLFRMVVLNSCGRHNTVANEYERGRVAESTLEWLKADLEKTNKLERKINILVCHHHPHMHEDLKLGTYDVMQGGQLLLDALGEFGDWIVFHGHKHHAKLSYASGSSTPPTIFAAGSFAGIPPDASYQMRNQFYFVDLIMSANTGPLFGTVEAWNWFPGKGWVQSVSQKDGIYTGCGFGYKSHPDATAKLIHDEVKEFPATWASVISKVPQLNYIIPKDLTRINKSLEINHQLRFQKDTDDTITEVAKVARSE